MLSKLIYGLGLSLGGLAALYVLLIVVLYFAQGKLLFIPPDVPDSAMTAMARQQDAEIVSLKAGDGTRLQAWHYRSNAEKVVIYTHGNGGFVGDDYPLKNGLIKAGWDVLAVGYRGYPGSEGSPSEEGIRQDILAVYAYAVETLGFAPEHIILHGRSLGGGVVGSVMLDVPVAGLVLQSTFTSAADKAHEIYPFVPVYWLMTNPFNTLSRASAFEGPVLVVHSTADEVIPVQHGRILAKAFANGEYIEIEGYGHNDLFMAGDLGVWRQYLDFINHWVKGKNDNERR